MPDAEAHQSCQHPLNSDRATSKFIQAMDPKLQRKTKMEAIWLKSYPPGVPAEVDMFEFASLTDVLLRSCHRFAALPAYREV